MHRFDVGPGLRSTAPSAEPPAVEPDPQAPAELRAAREELARRDERIRELEEQLVARDERVRELEIELARKQEPEPPVLPKPPPLPAGLRVPTPLPAPAAPDSNRLPNSTAKALRLPEVDVDPLPSLQQISLRSESRPHSERASEAAALQRRESLRVPAEFELTFVEDSYFISGLTQDISEGGLFVATYRLLPIGTPLSLSFQLPSGKRLDVKGVVRWVREEALGDARPGLGIAFSDLSEDALASIAEYCAVRPPLVFDM